MEYQFCAKTDPGRARENNEDSVAIDQATMTMVLADGMGGYNAGEIASEWRRRLSNLSSAGG